MASMYDKIIANAKGGTARQTVQSLMGKKPTQEVKPSTPLQGTTESKTTNPFQNTKLQIAMAGLQQPTQNDVNNAYDKLQQHKALNLYQKVYPFAEKRYTGDIAQETDALNRLTDFVHQSKVASFIQQPLNQAEGRIAKPTENKLFNPSPFSQLTQPAPSESPDVFGFGTSKPVQPQKVTSEIQDIVKYIKDPSYRNEIEKVYRKEEEGGVVNLDPHYKSLAFLTDKEKNILYGYSAKGDWKTADDYYQTIKPDLNARYQKSLTDFNTKLTEDAPVVGALANIASSYHLPAAYFANLGQTFKNAVTGNYEKTDTNSLGFAGTHIAQDTESALTKDMTPAGKFLTSSALSVGRMGAALPLGATGSLGLLASEAAGQTTAQALQSGSTPNQAALLGTIAGAVEAATEKIPLDNLFKAMDVGVSSFGQVVKNAAKQAGLEGSEEVISEYLNNISDQVIMGGKSQYAQLVLQNIDNGDDKATAERKAFVQVYIKNPLLAGAGGALTGGVLSGGTSMLNINPSIKADTTTQTPTVTPTTPNTSVVSQNAPQSMISQLASSIATPQPNAPQAQQTGVERLRAISSEKQSASDKIGTLDFNEGLGAADIGFDKMAGLVDKYGAMPSGAKNAEDRIVEFATQSSDGKYISKTVQSAAEANVTPVDLAKDIEDAAAKGYWAFDRNTDKGAMSRAIGKISTEGYWKSRDDFSRTVAEGKVSKDDIVLGQILYTHAANAKDGATAVSILTDLAQMQRYGAQATQAAFILKKLTPQWQLYSVEQMAEKMNERLKKTNKNFKTDKKQSEDANEAAKHMGEAVKGEGKSSAKDVVDEIEAAALRLSSKVDSTVQPPKTPKADAMNDMVNELFKSAKESTLPGKWTTLKKNPAEFLKQAIQNKEQFTAVWEQAKSMLLAKYANNPVISTMLYDYFNKGIIPTYSDATLTASVKQTLDALDMKLKDIKELTWQQRQEAINKIRNYLIAQTGATDGDAKQLSRDVTSKVTMMIIDSNPRLTARAKEEIKLATQDAMRKHGVETENWADETGRLLSKAIIKQVEPQASKQQPFSDLMLQDLKTFMDTENIPSVKSDTAQRTAVDRYTDFLNNPERYAESYARFKAFIRSKYANNPEMLKSLEGLLTTNAQQSAEAYIDKQVKGMISSALKDINVTISDLIDKNASSKAAVIVQITDLLTKKYNIEAKTAEVISGKVATRLNEIMAERSSKRLESMFPVKVDSARAKKSLEDKLARLINLGAFDSTKFNALAAERLFNVQNITIDKSLTDDFVNVKTEEERKQILKAIYKDIAKQIPATPIEKLNAWRYTSMLLNPLTHVKNVTSTAVNYGEHYLKNIVSIGLVDAANKVSPIINKTFKTKLGQIEKNRSLLSKKDMALVEYGARVYPEAAEKIFNYGKYNEVTNEIEDERQIFGQGGKTQIGNFLSKTVGVGVEKARTFTTESMTEEDQLLSKPAFIYQFAAYLKGHGVTEQTATPEIINNAKTFAIKEAREVAFRDINSLSEWVSKLGTYVGDNAIARIASTAFKGIVPFKTTPANYARQGIKFSPIGLIHSLVRGRARMRNGDITSAELVDDLSQGLVGTALFGLGALLVKLGVIGIVGAGDDKEDALEKTQGKKAFAIQIGEYNVPVDYLGTVSMPLFLGAKAYEVFVTNKQSAATLKSWLSVASSATSPILEMSMLGGINDFLENFKWTSGSDMSPLYYALTQSMYGWLGQFVPSIGGAIARSIDSTQRTYFTDKNSGLPNETQMFLQKQQAKVPGASSELQPYVDQWGRTKQTGTAEAVFNNLLNPFKYSKINVSPMEEELQRLYKDYGKANEKNVFPPASVDKYFSNNGEEIYMTADEFTQFKITSGKYAYSELTKLTSSAEYKKMSDEDKADAISKVYSDASEKAKTEVMDNKGEMRIATVSDGEKIQSYVDQGVSEKQAYTLYRALKDLSPETGKTQVSDYQKISTVLKQSFTAQQKVSVISTYFTEHNSKGEETATSLLPDLKYSEKLIALYATSKDSEVISMTVPSSFTIKKVEYTLTPAQKTAFRNAYIKYFNAHMSDKYTVENVKKLKSLAYEAAKNAALR